MSLPLRQVKCALTLSTYLTGAEDIVDHTASTLGYFDFVHKELVQFSYAHVQRSIPSVIDGFKPGQRKVLLLSGSVSHSDAHVRALFLAHCLVLPCLSSCART